MSWTIEKAIPTFAVPDLEVGIEFYARLGFEVDWRWPDQAPTHAGLLLGSCSIMLSLCDPAAKADVYFIVDDVSACHVAVLDGRCWELAATAGSVAHRTDCPPARSLQPPEPPEARGYGLRDFSIVDPWGHQLSFGQPSQKRESDMTLHELLDCHYGEDGEEDLRRMLEDGADPNQRAGSLSETALHVATRRRRVGAVEILLARGADIDAKTAGGKTAYAHAIRRKFDDVAAPLRKQGADTVLNEADQFAVAVVKGLLDDARTILAANPGVTRTGNSEEDRLLADVAGRNDTQPVQLLISAGANLSATGLDDGTPLHQAAWFGQPDNARLLIDAGAPLDIFDATHESSPIGWAVHGSRYSGDAEARQDAYVALVRMFLEAGSSLHYPGDPRNDAYTRRLLDDASPEVREVLPRR